MFIRKEEAFIKGALFVISSIGRFKDKRSGAEVPELKDFLKDSLLDAVLEDTPVDSTIHQIETGQSLTNSKRIDMLVKEVNKLKVKVDWLTKQLTPKPKRSKK